MPACCAHTVIQINDSRVEPDSDAMLSSLLYGDTVILTEGDARPVVVNTKGFSLRTASEPENERVLRGPREGFTEAFMPNLALIRRRVNDPRLKFSFSRMAGRTHTVVCLCWLEGVTDPALVREARRRLDTYALVAFWTPITSQNGFGTRAAPLFRRSAQPNAPTS